MRGDAVAASTGSDFWSDERDEQFASAGVFAVIAAGAVGSSSWIGDRGWGRPRRRRQPVQVHPDAASMATHMKVGMEHFATAYAEYLELKSTMQIYGVLTDDLIQAISAAAQTDGDASSVTIREPFAGFDRLPRS